MSESGFDLVGFSPDQRALIEAAALLERSDQSLLAVLLDQPVAEPLRALVEQRALVLEGPQYRVAEELRAAALDALDRAPQHASELHRRAAAYFRAMLDRSDQATHDPIEARYMRHFEQRCEALLRLTPTELAAEAAAAPLERLSVPAHRQLVRYYRGLGAGLIDQFAAAQTEFAALLNEPDLDDVVRGRALNSRALFALNEGKYELARDSYHESYTLWQRLGNLLRQATVLINLGALHYELHEYEQAETHLQTAVVLCEQAGERHYHAIACNELGLVARDRGRWDEALRWLHQAAAFFEREGPPDYLGRVMSNLGEIELLCGQYATASGHFAAALEHMASRAYAIDANLNLGLLQQAQSDDEAALLHYRSALDLAHEFNRRDVLALIHQRIAHAEQRLGRLDAAQASYAAALQAVEALREPVRDEGLLISVMGRWQLVYEAAIQFCLARDDAARAFDYAERARARAFADLLARRSSMAQQGGTPPVTAAQTQAALAPDTLLLAYFTTGVTGPETRLLDAIPPAGQGLRECLAVPARLIRFVVSAHTIEAAVCPLDPNALQRSAARQADGRRFLNPAVLRRAYSALIGGVVEQLAQARAVIVVPHGPLHQFPFAALIDGDGRTLLDHVPHIAYTPSATVLLRSRQISDTPSRSCLALGYDGDTGSALRHTQTEAAAIARLYDGEHWPPDPGVRLRLLERAADYRIVHLACHGEFDLDEPLSSWLEIGPAERLTAAEVLEQMRLSAELVTLSACHSGVNRILRGDEPMGLVRAFLSAGAQAVLVTLWPVEDMSARLLMEHFYRVLRAQTGPADPAAALQAAQRYLRALTIVQIRAIVPEALDDMLAHHDAAPFADPFFWAGYALVRAS